MRLLSSSIVIVTGGIRLPILQPANIGFYSFNNIRCFSGVRDDADQPASDDGRVGPLANLADMVGTRNAEPKRQR